MAITLADVEREVAPRLGPYRRIQVAAPGSANPPSFVANVLKSSRERGDVTEGTFILRRGVLADGSAVPGFVVDDRVREVKDYAPLTGTVTADRAYTVAPAQTEMMELHHLHPDEELRPAVLSGLRRCYFVDRANVTLTAASAERNITFALEWLTDPAQIYAIAAALPSGLDLPASIQWWRVFPRAGAVWLAASPDPYPNSLLVTALRPHFTYVNGAYAANGPTADGDTLAVPLDYAAAAAHIEAWRLWADRLADAAAEGRRATQAEAAREFTRLATRYVPVPEGRVQHAAPFGPVRSLVL